MNGSQEGLEEPEEALKFWADDEDDEDDFDNLSRLFTMNDEYEEDEMQELDTNVAEGSALSIFQGHAYTMKTKFKGGELALETERMNFINTLTKMVHKDRADMESSCEKVTRCAVGWFSRTSYRNKLHFILNLLEDNNNLSFLSILQRGVSSAGASKDLVYSTNQGIGAFDGDVVAAGQNMAMDATTLAQAQMETRVWCTSFSDLQKLYFFLSLLAGGGGAIVRQVYLTVNEMVATREKQNVMLRAFRSEGTFSKIASKYGLTEQAAMELPFDVLEREHNFMISDMEEERTREERDAEEKREPKPGKKGKAAKVKQDKKKKKEENEEEDKETVEEKEKTEVTEHAQEAAQEAAQEHPCVVEAAKAQAEFAQALEELRLEFMVDEFGKPYPPLPPPPLEEPARKKEKKADRKEEAEDEDETPGKKGKKGKKEKEAKKGGKPKKEKKEKPEKQSKKKGTGLQVEPGVDQIQQLPMTINRQIVAMLAEKQLKAVKQVSPYWAKMVDDIAAERKIRKTIDDALRKFTSSSDATASAGSSASGKKGKKGGKGGKGGQGGKASKASKSSKGSKGSKSSKGSKKGKSVSSKSSKGSARSLRGATPSEVTPSRVEPPLGLDAVHVALVAQEAPHALADDIFRNRVLRTTVVSSFFGSRVTAMSSDGRWLASSAASRQVEFYSLRTGAAQPVRLSGHARLITCMVSLVVQGVDHLVTGSLDNTVRLWNVPLHETERIFLGHTAAILFVAASDQSVVSVSVDKQLRVCDIWSTICSMTVNLDQVATSLAFDAATARVFVGFITGDIALYGLRRNTLLATVVAHDAEVTSLEVTSGLLVSAGADRAARLWTAVDLPAKCLSCHKHNSGVRRALLSDAQLVCACDDSSVTVWSVWTATRLVHLRMPTSCRPCALAAFSVAGYKRVVVSCDVACYVYEFQLYAARKARRGKARFKGQCEGRVRFEAGRGARGDSTGLPITTAHPPYHRVPLHEQRDAELRQRGFPHPKFFQKTSGVPLQPQGFLHDLLNFDEAELATPYELKMFPQAQSVPREIPLGAPAYPPPTAALAAPGVRLRREGKMVTSYQGLLRLYNARFPQ